MPPDSTRSTLREHFFEQVLPVDPEGGVVGAGVDAARLFLFAQAVVEVADAGVAAGGEFLRDRVLPGDRVHGDVAVGAVFGALAAADAVVVDDDGLAGLAVDGVDGAAHEALGVVAGSAGGGDEVLVEA